MSNEIRILEEALNVAAVKGCFNLDDSVKISHSLNVVKNQNSELREFYEIKKELLKARSEMEIIKKEQEQHKINNIEVVDPEIETGKPMPKNNKSNELKPIRHK